MTPTRRTERQGAAIQERLLRWTRKAIRGGRPIPVRLFVQSDEGSRGAELRLPRSAIGFPP